MIRLVALYGMLGCLLCGCSKKEEAPPSVVIDHTSVQVHYDEEHPYKLSLNGQPINPLLYTWTSSNEWAGTVDSTGKFTARFIGETTITASNGLRNIISKAFVTPYSSICKEPILEFGINSVSLKDKEKRKLKSNFGDSTLVYTGENAKILYVLYALHRTKLESSSLIFDTSSEILHEVLLFFKERYPYLGFNSGAYFYQVAPKTVVGIGVDEQIGLFAQYFRINSGGRQDLPLLSAQLKKQLQQAVPYLNH